MKVSRLEGRDFLSCRRESDSTVVVVLKTAKVMRERIANHCDGGSFMFCVNMDVFVK